MNAKICKSVYIKLDTQIQISRQLSQKPHAHFSGSCCVHSSSESQTPKSEVPTAETLYPSVYI